MAAGTKMMEAYVDITARLGSLKSALAKAKGLVVSAMQSIQKVITKMAQVGKRALIGLAAGFGIATWAAIKQEKAEFMLASALKVTGDFTKKTFERMKEFASSIQRVTVFGDEDTLMLMQMMKALGVTADQLEDATKQAIGMAAATNRDVKSMAMYIALAKQGETTMLRRYIPALRGTTNALEALKVIQDFTAKGFKLAQAEVLTTAGAFKQMTNAIGDVFEVIAMPFLKGMRETMISIKNWAIDSADAVGKMATAIQKAFTILIDAFKYNIEPMTSKLGELAKKLSGFTSEAKLINSANAVARWSELIFNRIYAVYGFIEDLWKSDGISDSIKYGLDLGLAQIEEWGAKLKVLMFGIAEIAVYNFRKTLAKGMASIALAIAEPPKSVLGKIIALSPLAMLTKLGTAKGTLSLAKKLQSDEQPLSMSALMDRVQRITARDVPMPPSLGKALKNFDDSISKWDTATKEWYDKQKSLAVTEQKEEADKKKKPVVPSLALPEGEKTKLGFVGLKEAWSTLVRSVQPMVVQQKITNVHLKEIATNTKNTYSVGE